jgi:hypothetical protein
VTRGRVAGPCRSPRLPGTGLHYGDMLGIRNRSTLLLLNNDRLSHWLAGAVLSWLTMFLLGGPANFSLMVKSSNREDSNVHRHLLCGAVRRHPVAVLGPGHTREPEWSDCSACRSGDGFVLSDNSAVFLLPSAELARRHRNSATYCHRDELGSWVQHCRLHHNLCSLTLAQG